MGHVRCAAGSPLGSLLVEHACSALLATNRGALLERNSDGAVAACVVHHIAGGLNAKLAAAGPEIAVAGPACAEGRLGARGGDLVLFARHCGCGLYAVCDRRCDLVCWEAEELSDDSSVLVDSRDRQLSARLGKKGGGPWQNFLGGRCARLQHGTSRECDGGFWPDSRPGSAVLCRGRDLCRMDWLRSGRQLLRDGIRPWIAQHPRQAIALSSPLCIQSLLTPASS